MIRYILDATTVPGDKVIVLSPVYAAWIMGPNVMAFHAMKAAYTHGDQWADEFE